MLFFPWHARSSIAHLAAQTRSRGNTPQIDYFNRQREILAVVRRAPHGVLSGDTILFHRA